MKICFDNISLFSAHTHYIVPLLAKYCTSVTVLKQYIFIKLFIYKSLKYGTKIKPTGRMLSGCHLRLCISAIILRMFIFCILGLLSVLRASIVLGVVFAHMICFFCAYTFFCPCIHYVLTCFCFWRVSNNRHSAMIIEQLLYNVYPYLAWLTAAAVIFSKLQRSY